MKRRKQSPRSGMKLEGGGEFKVRLTGQKLKQVNLNPEWIISEIKETETFLEPDGKTVVGVTQKITRTSTVRLYVDDKSIGEAKETVSK